MAISTNTNPIIICKGKRIATLSELQDNFDISKVCAYAKGGRLSQWLIAIGEEAVNEEIQGIDFSLPEEMLAEDLMVLLGLSEEQQSKIINDMNSKRTAISPVEQVTPVAEKSEEIKSIPQDLSPILRKVMALKNEVSEKIQDTLKNDCRHDEFSWDMHFLKEIGCSKEQILEIREYFGIPQDVDIKRTHSPMGIFITALLIKYPSRYTAGHPEIPGYGYSMDYKIIEKDAKQLGFPPPSNHADEEALKDTEALYNMATTGVDDPVAQSILNLSKQRIDKLKEFITDLSGEDDGNSK